MGDRGQVKIIGTNGSMQELYLYTHWTASNLQQQVAEALDRGRGRWGDDEYLNRIIFSEMIKDEVLEGTGYGIGFEEHGDVYKLIVVNHMDKTVGVMQKFFPDENDYSYQEWRWTVAPRPYEDFINDYAINRVTV